MHVVNQFIKKFKKLSPQSFEKLLIAMAALVFCLSLFAAHSARPYSSDDVSVQTIVQSWDRGQKRNAVMGTDNWLIKIPVYKVQDIITKHNSRNKLFFETLLFNAILLFGVIVFIRALVPKTKSKIDQLITYLPVTWFLGLSVLPLSDNFSQPSRITTFISPDLRNAELGIALLVLLWVYNYLRTPSAASSRFGIKAWLLFLFLGLFLYSDPYFLYTLILPSLALSLVFWFRNVLSHKKLILISLFLLGSVVLSMLIGKASSALGYTTVDNIGKQFIGFQGVWQNLSDYLLGQFKLFGADFWGQNFNFKLIIPLLNSLLLVGSLAALYHAFRSPKKGSPSMTTGLALIAGFNFLVFVTSVTASPYADRYLIASALSQVIVLSIVSVKILNPRLRIALIAILCAGVLINTTANLKLIGEHSFGSGTKPNALNLRIIKQVKQTGITKGYANYWDGNINTYLSDLNTWFLPVECRDQKLYKLPLAINKPAFDEPASKSFYLYSNKDEAPSLIGCDTQELIISSGISPYKSIKIDQNYTLYLYNSDIGAGFQDVQIAH